MDCMRKIFLMAGVVATAIGMSAIASGSAFAMGCLNNRADLVPLSLTHNPMADNGEHGAKSEGFGYDRNAYLSVIAQGNTCNTTEQSQPLTDNGMVGSHAVRSN